MSIALPGAVACVTGGGRGIGAAIALALAEQDAQVVIGDIDLDKAQEVAKQIGRSAKAIKLDVADIQSFSDFIAQANLIGRIAFLANNAGIQRTGAFIEQDLASQHREIAINLGGVITGTQLVLPDMLARNYGHIVNVSSMAGKMSVPGAAVYTASKFGVASLSRAIRAEIVASKVTLTTIYPSAVKTDLTTGLDISGVPKVDPEDIAKEVIASCSHGLPEVTVPKWLAPVGAIEQIIPERAGEFIKRMAGAQKRITAQNMHTRAYQERTARS